MANYGSEVEKLKDNGMSAAFMAAAVFDACALLVILIAIRGRPAAPAAGPAPRLVAVGQQAAE